MWMEHALQLLEREKQNLGDRFYNVTLAFVLDHLAFSTFKVHLFQSLHKVTIRYV